MNPIRAALTAACGCLVLGPSLLFAQDASVEASADTGVGDVGSGSFPEGGPEMIAPIAIGVIDGFRFTETVSVAIAAPLGWAVADMPKEAWPDISQVPAAEVKIAKSWRASKGSSAQVLLFCASAPARDWSKGMEAIVFDRLNTIAQAQLGKHMSVDSFTPAPFEEDTLIFQATFSGRGESAPGAKEGQVRVLEEDKANPSKTPLVVEGRHLLGFTDSSQTALVCSAACMEPAQNQPGCRLSLATMELTGDLTSPPSPTVLGHLVMGFRRKPIAGLGVFVGGILVLGGLALMVRGLLLRPEGAKH